MRLFGLFFPSRRAVPFLIVSASRPFRLGLATVLLMALRKTDGSQIVQVNPGGGRRSKDRLRWRRGLLPIGI